MAAVRLQSARRCCRAGLLEPIEPESYFRPAVASQKTINKGKVTFSNLLFGSMYKLYAHFLHEQLNKIFQAHVCMYEQTYSKSMDQPGKVANPVRC